jgi:hypothetical protein
MISDEFRELQRTYEKEMSAFDDERREIRAKNREITDRERRINARLLAIQRFDDELQRDDPDAFRKVAALQREVASLTNQLRFAQGELRREAAARAPGGLDPAGQRYYAARLEGQRSDLSARLASADARLSEARAVLERPIADLRMEEFDVGEAEADAELCARKLAALPELALDDLEEEQRELDALEDGNRRRRAEVRVARRRFRGRGEKLGFPPPAPQMQRESHFSIGKRRIVHRDEIPRARDEIVKLYAERQELLCRTEALTKAFEASTVEKRQFIEKEWREKIAKFKKVKEKVRQRDQLGFEISEIAAQIEVLQDSLSDLQKQHKQIEEAQGLASRNAWLALAHEQNRQDEERLRAIVTEIENREGQLDGRRVALKQAKIQNRADVEEYAAQRKRVRQVDASLDEISQKDNAMFQQCQTLYAELEASEIVAFSRELLDENVWNEL